MDYVFFFSMAMMQLANVLGQVVCVRNAMLGRIPDLFRKILEDPHILKVGQAIHVSKIL